MTGDYDAKAVVVLDWNTLCKGVRRDWLPRFYYETGLTRSDEDRTVLETVFNVYSRLVAWLPSIEDTCVRVAVSEVMRRMSQYDSIFITFHIRL